MSDTAETQADPEQPQLTITLDTELLRRLRSQVEFRTASDVRELVADAVNSYVQLGQLVASGTEILARQGEDGELHRVRLPFDLPRGDEQ